MNNSDKNKNNKVIPLKKLGQNYLRDPNIIRKIADEIGALPGESIIEIGPGTGALSFELVSRGVAVTAIELDRRVIVTLQNYHPLLKVIHGDFLETNIQDFLVNYDRRLRIAGNIPYNITSPIIFKLVENASIIQDAVLMIQDEVAVRITSKPGNKNYGILSAVLGAFAETSYCFKVSPNVFFPKPKVYSAVIHIRFRSIENEFPPALYIQTVKAAFGNRRKTLKNSLQNSIFNNLDFAGSPIDLTRRAETLSVDEFRILAKFLESKLDKRD